MKFFYINRVKLTGLFLVIIFLCINIATINDYGVTWDFSYHFNAGLWHLKLPLTDSAFIMGPSPPLSDILPTLGNIIFNTKLHIFPWDSAYNLYSVMLGSIGIGILYFTVLELFSWEIALFSSIILALLPRYFGHLHNNMKDIPQAVFFTLSIWLFWKLFQKPKISTLILAAFSFAISYNSKVNGLFILIITSLFYFINILHKYLKTRKIQISRIILLYFLLSPLFTYLLWFPFWDHPFGRLIEASHSYTTSTMNMPILYFGNLVYSGNNVPWHYPLGILAVTTPLILLIFAGIGIIYLIITRKIKFDIKLFILLWFLVPLSRYLKPHMIVIDDIRHFMEIIFPFAIISGVGMYQTMGKIIKICNKIVPKINKNIIVFCFLLSVIFYLSYQVFSYHPFQTSYYNEIVGGVKGANQQFDIEFWASSYKKALQYLNANAPNNSIITIPMAPDIGKLYLRKDLIAKLNEQNLAGVDSKIYSQSDYTVILNRQSFFNWYGISQYIENRIPVYTLTLYNIPLVSIYRN